MQVCNLAWFQRWRVINVVDAVVGDGWEAVGTEVRLELLAYRERETIKQ
jgi:hypothetical protein